MGDSRFASHVVSAEASSHLPLYRRDNQPRYWFGSGHDAFDFFRPILAVELDLARCARTLAFFFLRPIEVNRYRRLSRTTTAFLEAAGQGTGVTDNGLFRLARFALFPIPGRGE